MRKAQPRVCEASLDERQAVMAAPARRVLRRAMALQVGGRGHAQAAVVGQAHADQRRIGQIAHAHGAVEALAGQVHHAVAEVERDRHLGVRGAESAAPAAPHGGGQSPPAR
jgi:hypothetical protein